MINLQQVSGNDGYEVKKTQINGKSMNVKSNHQFLSLPQKNGPTANANDLDVT